MGRKAKKRVKSSHTVQHDVESVVDNDGHVDIIGDPDDHMLDYKRLKENGSIDMMYDDLDHGDHDTLSMPDELQVDDNSVDVLGDSAYDSKVTDSVSSEPEACHSDSDIIKTDIFDPAYDMHQNLVSSMGEYGAVFLNGMDHEGMLDVKHDPPPLPTIAPIPSQASATIGLDTVSVLPSALVHQPSVSHSVTEPNGHLVSNMISRPDSANGNVCTSENLIGSLPPVSLGDGSHDLLQPSSNLGDQVVNTISAAIPSVIPGAIPISPLFLPNTVAGLNPATVSATSTALAHISKIEPGADGKGYVLHLTIPALGLGNVMLSTEGLTFAHPDPKINSPGSANVACSPPGSNTAGDGSYSLDDTGSPDEVNINVDTDSPSPMSYPSDDNPVGDPAPELGLSSNNLKVKEGRDATGEQEEEEEEMFSAGSFINPGGAVITTNHHNHHTADCLPNHVLGTVTAVVTTPVAQAAITCAAEQAPIVTECQEEAGTSSATQIDLDTELKLTAVVEHNSVDKPEVDRFVICSDGPMVCVLCAFKTDSYSAFKSHIICSHPCWRITKKLSKNRLLVEKSVKMSTTLVHTNFNMPPSICNRKAGEQSSRDSSTNSGQSSSQQCSGAATSTTTVSSGSSPEKGRKSSMPPRKKQLIERNKRLFRCTKCLRLFVFEGSIVNHLMDYHSIKKPYDYIMVSNDHGQSFGNIHRCSHKNCFVTCTSELELEKHRLESHAQVVFRCQICGYTADNADAIKAHAVRIHHQQIRDYGPSD